MMDLKFPLKRLRSWLLPSVEEISDAILARAKTVEYMPQANELRYFDAKGRLMVICRLPP